MHNQLSISSINEEQELFTTLKMLHMLYPVQSVVHVGSGQGVGTMHLWQQFEPQNALFIDAMPLSSKIEKVLQSHPEWSFKQLLVSESNEEKLFYETTNPNENGLLDPKELTDIWSNLREKKSYLLSSATLDDTCHIEPNWLIIDTLTALRILRASCETLKTVDVAILRALKDDIEKLQDFLNTQGLKLCMTIEGVHPSVVDAVFTKDYTISSKAKEQTIKTLQDEHVEAKTQAQKLLQDEQAKLEKVTKELQAQESQTKETQKEFEALKEKLTSELEANKKSMQEALSAKEQAIANLQNVKATLEAEKTTLQNEKTALTKQKQDFEAQNKMQDESIKAKEQTIKTLQDEHVKAKTQAQKLLQDEQAKLEKVTKELQAQESQTKEIQKELETLRAAKSTAEQKFKELESKQQALVIKEQRLPQLESELNETRYKQQALENELVKAEAQIELIKDLLLREPGL